MFASGRQPSGSFSRPIAVCRLSGDPVGSDAPERRDVVVFRLAASELAKRKAAGANASRLAQKPMPAS